MKKETKECIRVFGIALAVMIAVPLAYRVCISIWPPKEKPHRSLDQFFREAEIAHSLELLATPVAKWSDADAKAEPEIYAWLKEQGIPRAVASGSKLVQVHHHLALLGLDDKFTMAISGFDIENSKPAPDIFLKAARELGTDPARTVVLEDSSNGIRAAHAGGFIPIMVPDHESPEEAHGLYRYVCKDLFEVRDLLASGAV